MANIYPKDKKFIKIRGVQVPIKITPEELEFKSQFTTSRAGRKPKYNTFRTNPQKFVEQFCNIYGVYYRWTKHYYDVNDKNVLKCIKINPKKRFMRRWTPSQAPILKRIHLEITAMDISVDGIGTSFREAKRRVVFQLHQAYYHKIIIK